MSWGMKYASGHMQSRKEPQFQCAGQDRRNSNDHISQIPVVILICKNIDIEELTMNLEVEHK